MNTFEKFYVECRGEKHDVFSFNYNLFFANVSKKKMEDRLKVDLLLQLDATLYMNLGSDSTKTEKEEVRKRSRSIYREIKKYNEPMGRSFLEHQDKT